MANNNGSKSSSPIKSWMKIAAGSTKSAFQEYMMNEVMPVTAEMARDLSASFKKTKETHKQGKPRSHKDIFRSIMQTPMARNLKSVVSDSWKEVKRGNIFMAGATGSAGSDDNFDIGGDDEDYGGSTTFGGDDENAQMYSGYDEIGDRISDQTEATYKAAEINMNATVMSSSAVIESQEKIGATIVSRLENINTSINTIGQNQMDKMEKFFETMTKSIDRFGAVEKKEPEEFQNPDSVFKKDGTGRAAGLNLPIYKRRVINNLKTTVKGMGGGTLGLLSSITQIGIDNLTPETVGSLLSTAIMTKVFENNIGKLGKQIETTIAEGIPKLVMGFTDIGNNPNSGKFAQMLGKIFGIDMTPTLDKPNVEFKGHAIPFDDQTKAAIVNVIPKHLSEISEYTKVLAQKVAKLNDDNIKKVRNKAQVFDMDDGLYKTREALTKEVFSKYYDAIGSSLTESEFGRGIKGIVNARTSNIKGDDKKAEAARKSIEDSYDTVMKQVAMFLYANGNKGVDLKEASWLEELGNYFKSQQYTEKEIKQLVNEIGMVAKKESVASQMGRIRYDILEAGKDASENLKKNPNLVDTNITNADYSEMDMAQLFTELYGTGDRRFKGAGFKQHESSGNKAKRSESNSEGLGYNPKRNKKKRGGRGSRSNRNAADNASLGHNDIEFNSGADAEDRAVDEYLGTQGRFEQDSQTYRMSNRINKIGQHGKEWITRVSKKFGTSGIEFSEAIFRGDTEKAISTMVGAITGAAAATGEFISKTVIDPAAKFIFGKKSENGYREGGMLSGVSNRIHDMMQSVSARIDGKEWTDASGTVHRPNPEDSFVNKAKATLSSAVEGFKKIFTDEKDTNDNKESIVDSIRNESKNLFSSAKKNLESLLYGKDYAELDEEGKKKRIEEVRENIADRTTAGIKGGLVGAGTSMALGTTAISTAMANSTLGGILGHSVIGTAILNPLVGAGIGFTVGFLSKSESFQRFFFGGEYTDANGETQWREGVVSKKMQDYFKKNKTTIGVSGAVGAGASLLTGSKFGWLGTILGGPLAGASIGITTALVAKSDTFRTFLFGDEEKGIAGIKQQWAKLTDKFNQGKTGPSITAEGLKAVGFGAGGAGAALLASKVGLLPSFFSAAGPGGLALLGMAGGITLAHKNLNTLLFGKDFETEEGNIERKEGIIGKFTNALKVTLIQPVANVGKSLVRTLNYQIEHNVLAPLRVAFYPVANFTRKLMKRVSDKVAKLGSKVSKGLDKYLLNPMKLFVRAITKPIANGIKLMGGALKAGISVTGSSFAKAVGLTGKLASYSMTDEEKQEWERQKEIAKNQKRQGRKDLRAANKADRLANKDRNTILKYTGGDYGDDTAEARRIAERRAGHKITWKNDKPADGWYTGRGSTQKNKFDANTTILSNISNTAKDILNWLKSKTINRNSAPTVGHAEGIDKVPEGETYVANENSTLGQREAISFPKANGKGNVLVEGKTGSFVVHNGGGEKVYNGSTEQPIPILVAGYTDTAIDQRNGEEVKVTEISDDAKEDTTEAIDDSEAVESNSISDKFKDYSTLFGKSIFGPDWEPKKGGLYDILSSAIGDTLGAVLTPFIGAAKVIAGVAKGAYNVLKIGWNIVKMPFKLGKWAGKKLISGGKKVKDFIVDHAEKRANGEGIDIGATISNMASSAYNTASAKITSTADTVHGNRQYAKIKKLITSGNSFYASRFDIYKDDDGREHIVAKEDVTFDDGTTVKKGQELKDALGAGNLLKRTEQGFADKARRRAENAAAKASLGENDNASLADANPEITSSLVPTNNILENILQSVQHIQYNGEETTTTENATLPDTTPGPDVPQLPDLPESAHIPGVTDLIENMKKPDKSETDGKATAEEGSAKVIQAKKAEEAESTEIQSREDENNASLKALVENSEDEKKTRESWFGKKGKLIKWLGIGALALFALYKFIGGKGLKSLLTNVFGAVFGSVKQLFGDTLYGLDNLTDQNDLATNIKETDVVKVASDSTGGFGLKTRAVMSGVNAIIKTGEGGVKAGLKALGGDLKNGVKSVAHAANPFVQVGAAKNSSMTAVSKAANTALTKHLENASANLTTYVAKAEASGTKTVAEAFTNFVTGIVKKAGGEATEAAVENATKSGVFKELLEAIKLKSAKIMAKVSGSKFAKGAAAVLTFGLSEAGFAVLGALNGASGAVKLFHVDKEDVDPLMIAISAAMGAFTSTMIGSIMDAAASIIAETAGLDLLCEVASFVYRLLGDDTKLDTAREKFRAGYEDYKDQELQKQYETYMIANASTVGSDYSYEDFLADVESGAKGAKLDSEITYNNKKNKSFLDKAGDFAVGLAKGAGNVARTVGTGLFRDTELVYVDNDNEVLYRQQGKQWYAFKWTGKVLVSVGLVDEASIPDSAIAVKCRKVNWFDKVGGKTDEVNQIPKRYGWSAWNGTEVSTQTGEAIQDETDVVDSNTSDDNSSTTIDEDGFGGGEGTGDGKGSATLATTKYKTEVGRYNNSETNTINSMTNAANWQSASYATMNRDEELLSIFGEDYRNETKGLTSDEIAEKYNELARPDQGDLTTYEAEDIEDPAELKETLKSYALYIRDWSTGEYTNGFFLVHPNDYSFIKFTMAGQFFNDGYDWTSVLSAWLTGTLISKKINNYNELINSLKEDGIDIDVVDPNDIENEEDEDSGSIFDVISKAFSSMFSAFNKSWRKIMTSEEVDKEMEKPEEAWVDKVYGKKIVRPISSDGTKPTSSNFKAATYLFYVLDGSKKFFREYNIFQTYTGMEIPVEVVKNWVKSSEAWIVFSDKEAVNYDEDGAPDIQPIDPNDIKIYQVEERADGLLGVQAETPSEDDKLTAEERATLAENEKKNFKDYQEYESETDDSTGSSSNANATLKDNSTKSSGDANALLNAAKSLGLSASDIASLDRSTLQKFIDSVSNTGDGKVHIDLNDIVDTAKLVLKYAKGESSLTDKLALLTKYNELKNSDAYKLISDNIDIIKNAVEKNSTKNPNKTNESGGKGDSSNTRLSSRSFSNTQREELDKRYANIKTATAVSDANARTMSQLVSAEDAATSEVYSNFKAKSREESLRYQFSKMLTPTQVLMGMDGTYWVWDRVNTFHRYTYFGQDIAEELTNDEMLALFKNGRYLVEEKPISYLNRMQTTLTSNLTKIGANFSTGLSAIANGISYVTSYVSGDVNANNIYTTGSTAVTNTKNAVSNTASSIWDKAKNGLSDLASTITNLVSKNNRSSTSKNPSTNSNSSSRFKPVARGGFGDRLNGVPYYSQNDSRWKNADYSGDNDNATMGDAGCGPTVLSMVDNYFGGHDTPTDYARLAQNTGYRDDTGTNWDFINSATNAMGLNTSQIENPDSLDIADQLSIGQPIILSGVRTQSPSESPYTKSGHYVVATGLNPNGTVNISDPRGRNYSKAFPLDKLASDTGSMWGFGGKGGFGKIKKAVIKQLNSKKKSKGGGRGKYTADEARQIILDWQCALYHTINYYNGGPIINMDGAIRGNGTAQNDCSGLQQWVYRQAAGIEIGRDTKSQGTNGFPIIDKGNGDVYCQPNYSVLKPGDLIYYIDASNGWNDPGHYMRHVEMYVGGTTSIGIGSPLEMGSRLRDVKQNIESGSSLNCDLPQKYWGTKRIIQDGQTYDMNKPDPSWKRLDLSTLSTVTPGTSGTNSDSSSSSSSTSSLQSSSKSKKSKDFFETFSSLMGEVGNRYAKGVATGNFDTNFTDAFNEILNGGDSSSNSGGNNNSSLGNYTNLTTGSYVNGGIYNGDYIGAYVKKFESGANGIRNGLKGQHCGNDWGRSWGSYSMTHHWGTAIRFLKKYYPDLAANLRYDSSGDGMYSTTWNPSTMSKYISSPDEVSTVWQAAINQDGDDKFFANEHQHIADNFYLPMLNSLAGVTKFNPDTHSRAAQELMWSWAVAAGGESAGGDQFKDTGIADNNVSVNDLLAKSYQVRIARTKNYDAGSRYRDTGNPSDSEFTTLKQIADLKPFKAPSTQDSKSDKKKPTKTAEDGTVIKENSADDTSGKGGFGDGSYKSKLKKEAQNVLKSSGKIVHVSDPKTRSVNLKNLLSIESGLSAYESVVGDISDNKTKVNHNETIPGSNGIKTADVASGKGGYGNYVRHGGRGDIQTTSTAEKALNTLVNLVEVIVDYVSQSNNKLDYLKDIKNQQVVVKEGDKNIAIANPSGGTVNASTSTNNKSIGRLLAEILASG